MIVGGSSSIQNISASRLDIGDNIIELEFKYSYKEFIYSYKEVIQLFIIVFNYHKDKKENEIHLKEFEEVSKKLNYPLFSKDYLMNYFK